MWPLGGRVKEEHIPEGGMAGLGGFFSPPTENNIFMLDGGSTGGGEQLPWMGCEDSQDSPSAMSSCSSAAASVSSDELSLERESQLKVSLYHKSRCEDRKLSWALVLDGESIRAGQPGKLIRAHVSSPVFFLMRDVEIRLVLKEEQNQSVAVENTVEFISIKPSRHGVPYDNFDENVPVSECVLHLKISQANIPSVQFFVSVTGGGEQLSASSVRFFTHNNGKKRKISRRSSRGSNEMLAKMERTEQLGGNLEVAGWVKAKAFRQLSDKRYKTDIQDLRDALGIVLRLEGKSYRWKEGVGAPERGGERVLGLIAQEVRQVVPEVVHEEGGYLSVSYTELIPVLIEALKQHASQASTDKEVVKNEMQDLKEMVNLLSARLASLSTAVLALSHPLVRVAGKSSAMEEEDSGTDWDGDVDLEAGAKWGGHAEPLTKEHHERALQQSITELADLLRVVQQPGEEKEAEATTKEVLPRWSKGGTAGDGAAGTGHPLPRSSLHRFVVDYFIPALAVMTFVSMVVIGAAVVLESGVLRHDGYHHDLPTLLGPDYSLDKTGPSDNTTSPVVRL